MPIPAGGVGLLEWLFKSERGSLGRRGVSEPASAHHLDVGGLEIQLTQVQGRQSLYGYPESMAQKSTSSLNGSVGKNPSGGGSLRSPSRMNALYES